jgi:hypothetical protein
MGPVLTGVVMMAAGIAILFAMVIHVIAPNLFLAMLAYAVAFSGMLLGAFALLQRSRRR